MDPEMDGKVAQLESGLTLEQQRLEKLWDAYEQQEKDLNASLDQINILEADIETKGTMIASLQELLGERDSKLRELEVERQRQMKVEAEYAPKIISSSLPVDRIGEFIGPGGKNIKSLSEEYECDVNGTTESAYQNIKLLLGYKWII